MNITKANFENSTGGTIMVGARQLRHATVGEHGIISMRMNDNGHMIIECDGCKYIVPSHRIISAQIGTEDKYKMSIFAEELAGDYRNGIKYTGERFNVEQEEAGSGQEEDRSNSGEGESEQRKPRGRPAKAKASENG